MPITVDDLSCVRCGGNLQVGDPGLGALVKDHLHCLRCGHDYASLWGIPYIADFETADLLSLFEIAANIDNAEQNESHTKTHFDQWRDLLNACHDSDAPHDFMRNAPDWAAPWIHSRFNQWYQYTLLTKHLDLKGAKALDVGAGLGFDTSDVLADGASVTAIEFSPLLARAGQKALPEVRWIGGVSHALPFDDNVFDFIFCNAALHHMRDVPAALSEMIRVVRNGGTIMTTSDSYCADRMPADLEVNVFNNDPAVLSGVNEGIVRFGDLAKTLDLYSENLDIEAVVDARGTPYEHDADRFGYLLLDFKKHREIIANCFQSISLKITVKENPTVPRLFQLPEDIVLPAYRYAKTLENQPTAIASLTSMIQQDFVDTPFPGNKGSKLSLLNGWQNPTPMVLWRQGYNRSRLFFSRNQLASTSRAYARCVVEKSDKPNMSVLINGKVAHTTELKTGCWTPLPVPWVNENGHERYAIEFQLHRQTDNFDEGLFRISFVGGWRLWLSERLTPLSRAVTHLRYRYHQVKRVLIRNKNRSGLKLSHLLDRILQIELFRTFLSRFLQKITAPMMQSLVDLNHGDLSNAGLLNRASVRNAVLRHAVDAYLQDLESTLGQELQCHLSFSHEGEDILYKHLTDIYTPGFYVDVGAHDPRAFSNTYLLYRLGWHGVNIDATPGSMDKFKRLRPRDINIECGISDSSEEFIFHTFSASALNTFSKAVAQSYISNGWESTGQVKIKARPLSAILDEVLPANQTIDLLNVDVEGNEYSVLSSNDWDRYLPKVIFVEMLDVVLGNVNETPVATLLRSLGYTVIAKLSTTYVFQHDGKATCAE